MGTTGGSRKQQNTPGGRAVLGSRRGTDGGRDASPAILFPNDLQHPPHHVAHRCLGRLGRRHPPALCPDQIHQLPWKREGTRLSLLGAHPPHDGPEAPPPLPPPPGPVRRRPALTGPAPSPMPDDLPQQRQRLPCRVLGARPLPATPQPRHEGFDLLRQLRAALGGARHGGDGSTGPAGLRCPTHRFHFRPAASPLAKAAKVLPPPGGGAANEK